MTVTIVPANPEFFVIHARPGETEYEIFSRVPIIAWRIEDESQIPPEPITPVGVCRHNSDGYPRALRHPQIPPEPITPVGVCDGYSRAVHLVTSLNGRVVGRTYPNETAWLEDCCTPEERATFQRRIPDSVLRP